MRFGTVTLIVTILLLVLVACGGGEEQAGPTDATVATLSSATTEPAEESEAGDNPATDAPTVAETSENQESETASDSSAATPSSTGEEDSASAAGGPLATAEASGLPINPDPIVPGEEYIIIGTLISAAMIPVDAPQFLIEGDNGVRYRVNSQAAADIFVEDGTQLLPHQFRPGLRVMATASLPADASATDVAQTTDLVVLLDG